MYLLLIFISGILAQDGPLIETTYGPVEGSYKQNSEGLAFEEYLGIPYGAPPIGDDRWTKPQPPDVWTEPIMATEYPPHCIQFIAIGYPAIGLSNETSEDCLNLNVYVPGEARAGDDLAVMVWIYGGAYILGTAAMYPAQDLALFGDVIVVQMNFRIGPIGFLSTEDEAAKGNYGLWDVQLALQWVQDNVALFGGDPNRVTVFGQSAGGSMTSHMMVSPETQGLFQRGISLSGASSGFFGVAIPGNVADSVTTLARLVGCRRLDTNEELVDCLRQVNATELDFFALVGVVGLKQQLPNFIPVIDGEFIPQHPSISWTEGAASDCDIITGFTRHDAAAFITANPLGMPVETINFAETNDTLDRAMSFVTNHYPDGETGKVMIYEQYPGMEDEDLDNRTIATVEASTDWWFASASHYEAREHASAKIEGRRTYQYRFQYDQTFLEYPEQWITGSHLDDVYSVFGETFMEVMRESFMRGDGLFNDTDRQVMNSVMSYYTNFAKTGDPNEGAGVPIEWPQYDSTERQVLDISDNPAIFEESDARVEEYRFWIEDFNDAVMSDGLFVRDGSTVDDLPDDEDELTDLLYDIIPGVLDGICAYLPPDPEACYALFEAAEEYMQNRIIRLDESAML